ncbi:MAG: gliding motility-associated C-terminal domain-containing protein [Tannerella sp.]|jgi:gliding motility-associated-like protein|nr:gliding motility-associated C-terminal domain-containing protein [Tannerella sp.]
MDKRNFILAYYIFCALIAFCGSVSAQQYTVSGGDKEPLLAVDNGNYRLKVFLIYGSDNLKISYTSASGSHKWYRYKTKVDELNPEPVTSVQNGTSSYITDIEAGYGYYVDENGPMRYYVWITDYSKYSFDVRSISLEADVDPCIAFRLDGDADMPEMVYYTPGGASITIPREFEIEYETLKWHEETTQFVSETHTEKFTGDPFSRSFSNLPLKDTEIILRGDMFARHFGIEKSASIPFFEAKAVEVYADTLINSSGSGNVAGSESELSAPVDITFRAFANTPVASRFLWQIFKEDEPDRALIHSTTETVDYTFDRQGSYIARLEVSDRSGSCFNDEHTFQISITETVMEIPNAFSPGVTPGVNDIFRVKYKSVVRFQGWIYNRWGNELFHWSDPSQGWDGKYNGKYVPAGAYYYLIEYTGTDGKKRVRTGDVNVFRSARINMEKGADEVY